MKQWRHLVIYLKVSQQRDWDRYRFRRQKGDGIFLDVAVTGKVTSYKCGTHNCSVRDLSKELQTYDHIQYVNTIVANPITKQTGLQGNMKESARCKAKKKDERDSIEALLTSMKGFLPCLYDRLPMVGAHKKERREVLTKLVQLVHFTA